MKVHIIDAGTITTFEAMHAVFAAEFGFPEYYGNNMDAWIDCMSDLAEPVLVYLKHIAAIKGTAVYEALIECSALVNYRMMDTGKPMVTLAFCDQDHLAQRHPIRPEDKAP